MGLLAVPSSKGARAERESAYYDRYGENSKQNSVTGFKGFAHGKTSQVRGVSARLFAKDENMFT